MPRARGDNWVEGRASLVIDLPVADVFEYACNPLNDARWVSHVVAVNKLTDGPIAVGSKYEHTIAFAAGKIVVEWAICEYITNCCLIGRNTGGPIHFESGWHLAEVNAGTRTERFIFIDLAKLVPFLPRSVSSTLLCAAMKNELNRLVHVLKHKTTDGFSV